MKLKCPLWVQRANILPHNVVMLLLDLMAVVLLGKEWYKTVTIPISQLKRKCSTVFQGSPGVYQPGLQSDTLSQ